METFNEIASDILRIPLKDVKDSLSSADVPGWDSLNFLKFITELEERFDVSFSMDDLLKVKNLGNVKKILLKKGVKLS